VQDLITGLRRLGRDAGLLAMTGDGYRLDVALADVAAPSALPQLAALLEADIAASTNALGVGARHTGEGIRFHFPVSIMAWQRGH
jgi:hypothetical protein